MVYDLVVRRCGVLSQLQTVTVQPMIELVGGACAALPRSATKCSTPLRSHELIFPCLVLHCQLGFTANRLGMTSSIDSA
jgi:hypothetical protein